MKSDSGFLQVAGLLFNRNRRLDQASDSPTDPQIGIKANLAASKIPIPTDRAND
jgi:hypothetical protein